MSCAHATHVPYARLLAQIVSTHEDGAPAGHSVRLEDLARRVVAELAQADGPCLPPEASLWPAAMLVHDVGKLAVPAVLLRKPGGLAPEEIALVRSHTLLGHDWLERFAAQFAGHDQVAHRFWRIAAAVAGGHHERPDGRGYPLGLSGDAVPLLWRVARLVDVYDALTSRRTYREALAPADALRMMRDEIGGFDECLLQALEAAMEPAEMPLPHAGGWE